MTFVIQSVFYHNNTFNMFNMSLLRLRMKKK